MSNGDERQIRMGDEQYTSVRPFDMPWRISAKGNPFLSLDIGHTRIVISVFPSRFRRQDEWTFSVMLTEGQWQPSRLFYASVEDAKAGALQELAILRRQIEGGPPATNTLPQLDERPPDPSGRRIRLPEDE